MKRIICILSFIILSCAQAFGQCPWGIDCGGGTADDTAYDAGTWDGNTDAPTKNAVRDKIETVTAGATGVNETYGSGWNADASAPEKDDIYDYLHYFDADDDHSFTDETWFSNALAAYQAASANLTTWSGVTPGANVATFLATPNSSNFFGMISDEGNFISTLWDDANASAARTTLGLAIGTNVQAYDADLSALAGLTSAANTIPYFTGSGTAGVISSSANMVSLLGSADYATARTNLGLAIGTNVQAYDADLTTWAGITTGSGVGTFLATPSSANFFSMVTGETGSGAVVGGTAPGFTTSANPASADGATLGTTALEWSDIYFADGGVIYGQNDQSATLTSSASLWTANNFSVTTQFKLPSSNADPTATAGYFRHDSTITNFTNGGLVYYNGAAIKQVVDMTTATASACTDDQVVAYDADNDLWYCKADSTGAGASGTLTTIKEATSQVGGADIVTLDFGAGFDLTESPDTEINIALDLSEYTGAIAGSSLTLSATSSPTDLFNDSDAPGADKEIAKIVGAYVDGADGAENGTLGLYAHEAGTTTEYIQLDGKNTQVEITKKIIASSTLDLSATTDATIARSGAGAISVEGVDVAMVTNAKLNRYHQTAHVDPNEVYSGHAGVIVLDPKTAAAITITEIAVYLDEDPTTELTVTCNHKTAAIGYTGGTTIDANDTASGTFTATTFDDATVPSGSKMWCVIGDDPDATNTDMEISLTGTYD